MSNRGSRYKRMSDPLLVIDLEYVRSRRVVPKFSIPLSPDEYKELEMYLKGRIFRLLNSEDLEMDKEG